MDGIRDIERRYGVTYRHTLAQLIALNTDIPLSSLPPDVFFAPPPDAASPLPSSG